MSQAAPAVGELVAVTRDVPEASVRRGETGMVVGVQGDLVCVCLDGDAQEVKVPREAVLRFGPALATEAQPQPGGARNGGWFQFSWSSLASVVLMMTVMAILPTCRLLRQQERIFSPPPPKQKVQQVPIRVPGRRPGRIERPPPAPWQQPPGETP